MSAEARWDKVIFAAIEQVRVSDWAGLAEVRQVLDVRGTSRSAQDANFKRMSREGKVALVPESNQKTLTEADRAAAIKIGHDYSHLIKIR